MEVIALASGSFVTPLNAPTYLTVQGHILWYLKAFSFPQVMLVSPSVAVCFFLFRWGIFCGFLKVYSGRNQAVATAITPRGLPKAGQAER